MATHTANGEFNYETKYYGFTLEEWQYDCHKDLSDKLNWKYFPLIRGSFGFDNMICSIGTVFNNITKFDNIDEIASQIHNGWIKNYIYWRDNSPHEKNSNYKAPTNPLNDERRNTCANTSYDNLNEDEKNKDKIIAGYIIKNGYIR